MNQFWCLVSYEYKKLLLKKSVVVAIIAALGVTVLACFTMVMGSYSGSNHNVEGLSNYEVMLLDKSNDLAFAGRPLDEKLILEASRAYQKVDTHGPAYNTTDAYYKYARPYSKIYYLVDSAYTKRGEAFNVEDFQHLSEEDAKNYYAIREQQLRTNLTNNSSFSQEDIKQILAMDEDVEKPFTMAYTDGYQRVLALSITTMMAILFLLSFIISPIFSSEYSQNTDSLLLTAKYGKSVLIYAKVVVAVAISSVLVAVFLGSTYFTCMGVYGFEGARAQVQLLIPLMTYDWTLIETVGILFITSILGGLLHTAICMSISAYTKKTIIPMAISTLLIVMSMFNGITLPFFEEVRYFLPLAMGSFYDTLSHPTIIRWFGIGIPLYQAVCIVSIVLSTVLILLAIRGFRKHQVV